MLRMLWHPVKCCCTDQQIKDNKGCPALPAGWQSPTPAVGFCRKPDFFVCFRHLRFSDGIGILSEEQGMRVQWCL